MRLIDADVLIKHLCEVMTTANHFGNIERVSDIGACIGVVKGERTFNIKRPRGEWVQVTAKDGQYYCYHKCTNCGQTIESGFDNPPLFNFCPQCGADMRKGGDS